MSGRARAVVRLTAIVLSLPTMAQAQQVIGAVGAASLTPTGRAPGGTTRNLVPGGDVFFKDRIKTKRGGSAQIAFLDRSTMDVGENSDLVIDEFFYKPGAKPTLTARLTKGVLHYVGGEVSHAGGTTIETPVMTVGIRGGIGTIGFIPDAKGIDKIAGVPGDFHGGAIVINSYGSLTVRNDKSEVVLSRPGFAVFVGSRGGAIAAPVRLDQAAMAAIMHGLTRHAGQRGGQQNGFLAKAIASTASHASTAHMSASVVAMRSRSIDALSFTSIFSAGSALARNRSQSTQVQRAAQQITSGSKTMEMSVAQTPGVELVPAQGSAAAPRSPTGEAGPSLFGSAPASGRASTPITRSPSQSAPRTGPASAPTQPAQPSMPAPAPMPGPLWWWGPGPMRGPGPIGGPGPGPGR